MCIAESFTVTVPASCLECGSELRYVNGTWNAGTQALAVVACTKCPREFTIECHLRGMRT